MVRLKEFVFSPKISVIFKKSYFCFNDFSWTRFFKKTPYGSSCFYSIFLKNISVCCVSVHFIKRWFRFFVLIISCFSTFRFYAFLILSRLSVFVINAYTA